MAAGEMVLEQEIDNLSINAYKDDTDEKNLIVMLDGAIDTYNAQQFETILNKLINNGYINLLFSCAKLNYLSSMGIGIFINLKGTLTRVNGSITFSEMQDKVYHIFDQLGFIGLFNFQKE